MSTDGDRRSWWFTELGCHFYVLKIAVLLLIALPYLLLPKPFGKWISIGLALLLGIATVVTVMAAPRRRR